MIVCLSLRRVGARGMTPRAGKWDWIGSVLPEPLPCLWKAQAPKRWRVEGGNSGDITTKDTNAFDPIIADVFGWSAERRLGTWVRKQEQGWEMCPDPAFRVPVHLPTPRAMKYTCLPTLVVGTTPAMYPALCIQLCGLSSGKESGLEHEGGTRADGLELSGMLPGGEVQVRRQLGTQGHLYGIPIPDIGDG